MSTRTDEEMARAKEKLAEYDFVRFVITNFHGQFHGRTVMKPSVQKFLEEGAHMWHWNFTLGTRNELVLFTKDVFWGNALFLPDPTAIYPLPWATEGEYKVAMILGENYIDGRPMEMVPRHIVKQQLKELSNNGLTLMSGFEIEFMIVNKNGDPLDEQHGFQSYDIFSRHEKLTYRICEQLKRAGIIVETISPEYAEGQIEVTIVPSFGMEAIDSAVVFKSAVKEICYQLGYKAVFMTHPFVRAGNASNGLHQNHSLWDLSMKTNMMFDGSDKNKMSSIYKHWLAGLLKHGPALTALCCPTVNCYRRLHKFWSPSKIDWGIDNRMAAFRVKNEKEASTYLENRIPSSAANPYLCVAGIIAAGLDGIKNKLDLGPAMEDTDRLFPRSLEEALQALENDAVIVAAMGEEFIDCFAQLKRKCEIQTLNDVDITDGSDNNLVKERSLYLDI